MLNRTVKPKVKMNGKVYMGSSAIGDVERMGKGWVAHAYGRPSRYHEAPLRREAVTWVVTMRNELSKVIEQE